MHLKLHTLVIVIGPMSCGKSYLIDNFIKPQLQKKLSYHKIRNTLPHIDTKDIHRTTDPLISKITKKAMQEISIINQLSQYMDFPFSEPFIILECSLCDPEFIIKCKNIAAKYHYNIEYINFNYKTHKDFLKFAKAKKSTQEHVEMYKKNILSQLTISNIYDLTTTKTSIYNIVTDFNIVFDENNFENFIKHSLDMDKKYFIVGDIHSCIDEFKELLIKNKFTITDDIITCNKYDLILIGDLIDKGYKNTEMINFIHKNINNPRIKFVKGNHEKYIYDFLNDANKQYEFKPEFISKYFNTFLEIKDSPETIAKFTEIYNLMQPFYFYDGIKGSHSFYVNHSPCSRDILYKIDDSSNKHQIYRNCVNFTEAKLIPILSDKNDYDVPYHVVGHLQMEESYFTTNNMVFIDTGCIFGGKLTGVKLGKGILYPKFSSVNFMNKQPAIDGKRIKINNTNYLSKNEKNNTENKFTEGNISNVVKKLTKNKINFISGTISPANKLMLNGTITLESLDSCFSYFYNKYQEKKCYSELVVMPKYMGSRINVYLFRDFEQSYGITRNGYKTKVSLEIFKNLYDRLYDYMTSNNIKMMIIDGELMPWNLLAKGLIDETFGAISTGLQHTSSLLQRTGFDIAYDKLYKSTNNMNKTDKTCFTQQNNSHITAVKMEELGKKYTEQLNLYAQDDVPHIKAFSILKIVFEDDTEFLPGLIDMSSKENILEKQMTNETCFKLVNDDEILVINLNDSYDDSLDTIKKFFNNLVDSSHEGIIVRPNLVDPKIMTPYMKVRNEGYLRLTYGYDYQESKKYQQLVRNKNIKKKLELSKQQFNLGVKMLKVPYVNLNKDKDIIKKYIETFLKSDINSKNIDPRL